MWKYVFLYLLPTLVAVPAFATVTVSSPVNNSTVASPVHYVASATSSTCAQGVAAMGVYVNNNLVYTVNGSQMDTTLSMAGGAEHTVVEEWDFCGGATYATENIFVGSAPPATAVTVTSPAAGATVSAPVHYVASATTNTCAGGVAAMGIYDNNNLIYTVNGSTLDTSLALANGAQHTVVEEWDYCGGAAYTTVNIYVGSAPPATAVTISSPAPGSTMSSPVHYVASATTNTCAGGVSAMGIYVNNQLVYTVSGSSLNTSLAMADGPEHTVVEEWDYCGGAAYTVDDLTVASPQPPTVSITAKSSTIAAGSSTTLMATATAATSVTITGSDGSANTLSSTGGSINVSPTSTTVYTAQASGSDGSASAHTTVTVEPASSVNAISHVIFMLQENHSFDNYFGMLNPYRRANGWNVGSDSVEYDVDGIDDKLSSISNPDDEGDAYPLFKFRTTCVDDMTSAWLASYGDVNRYNFLADRPIQMNGFVHNAEGYAKSCQSGGGSCSGAFADTKGERAMGYYDQDFLNYYYYMASQFAISDRWFSPVSSKSITNRIATFTGGTTQGLTRDPGDDKLGQLSIPSIFQELDQANVPWKIYFTVTEGFCLGEDECSGGANARYPATDFSNLSYSYQYLYENPTGAACVAPAQPSSVVGDSTNSFCIDPNHIAPLSQYFTDLTNGTVPSFAFIEAGYANNDEHPGSGQSILQGQAQVAKIVGSLMSSTSWGSSVFFLSYDEGGGPYDHVAPVPHHSNDSTDAALGAIPDISQIAINADGYNPCLPSGGSPTLHCDLVSSDPGTNAGDAAAQQGFAAQLGFRVPNVVISPFARKHYVSHSPMDHTAVIKFVENRFISSSAHLTARDAAQPNLLDFFDFAGKPWGVPPTPPAPTSPATLGYDPCAPTLLGP